MLFFYQDGSNLVLADKNGDVYSFAFRDAVEETKPNLGNCVHLLKYKGRSKKGFSSYGFLAL